MAKALTALPTEPRTPQRAPLCPLEQRASLVLHRLMKHLDLNDSEVARSLAISRSTVQGKRTGTVRITIDELEAFAGALHVEPFVFFLEPDEAVRWALDNRESGSTLSNLGWNVPIPPVSHITQCDLLRAA